MIHWKNIAYSRQPIIAQCVFGLYFTTTWNLRAARATCSISINKMSFSSTSSSSEVLMSPLYWLYVSLRKHRFGFGISLTLSPVLFSFSSSTFDSSALHTNTESSVLRPRSRICSHKSTEKKWDCFCSLFLWYIISLATKAKVFAEM